MKKEPEQEKEGNDGTLDLDFEEDFEEDLDLEEELDLLDTEDLEAELEKEEKLIDKDEAQKQLYLSCGIHIGTKLLSGDARRFIYRQTNYGLYVIDLTQTDKRLKIAAKFVAQTLCKICAKFVQTLCNKIQHEKKTIPW